MREDLIQSAAALAPELSARAAEGDELRTLPADLVTAFRDAGFFLMASPRSMGGIEADPVTIIEVVERLSAADGSAGWTAAIGNGTSFLAWLEPDAAAELLDGGRQGATGVFGPQGRARRVGDGMLELDGRWGYCSGAPHADLHVTGFLLGDDVRTDGRPDWRFAYYRAEDAVIHDTWRASGLRGTGSHDVEVRGLRLPDRHTAMPMFDPPRHDGPLLEVGFRALTGVILTGFPLGVGRRALDEAYAIVPGREVFGGGGSLADDRATQLVLGRAEAALQAARALALDAAGEAWEAINKTGAAGPEHRARVLLATQQAMEGAAVAVEAASSVAGASAVFEGHPVGRCARDLWAARRHVAFSGGWLAEYAKARIDAA